MTPCSSAAAENASSSDRGWIAYCSFAGYAGSGRKYSSCTLNANDIISGSSFISSTFSSSRALAIPNWMIASRCDRIRFVRSAHPWKSVRDSCRPSSWIVSSR
nr:hypothetical protein [Actinocatenispora rupis]